MNDFTVVIIRQAAEGGQLYGSVTTRDIAEAAQAAGVTFDRTQVSINQAFKTLGLFPVDVYLHPEVKVIVTVNIARSEEEAKVQKKLGRALVADAEGKIEVKAPAATPDKSAYLEDSALTAEQQEEAQAQADAQALAEKSAKRAAKKATKKTDEADEAPAPEDAAE
jgi:large subunit ribosomal protein L9